MWVVIQFSYGGYDSKSFHYYTDAENYLKDLASSLGRRYSCVIVPITTFISNSLNTDPKALVYSYVVQGESTLVAKIVKI